VPRTQTARHRARFPKAFSAPRHRSATARRPDFRKAASRMGLRGLKKCALPALADEPKFLYKFSRLPDA